MVKISCLKFMILEDREKERERERERERKFINSSFCINFVIKLKKFACLQYKIIYKLQ